MNILVTGGAGFIGSNLTEALIADSRISKIRILDNLSNGSLSNLSEFTSNPKFEFIEGDIRDLETCMAATKGIDKICHLAALGSVPRSVKDPITTHDVNVTGTLNLFKAAVDNKIERVVFASSSSVYGDNQTMPKVEDAIGAALSPYALTKQSNELYAEVFAKNYQFNYIGLRYFNIFGPKQSPKGPYAAVIPIFMENAIMGQAPTINGDGNFSRDFTYVSNAVDANIKALFSSNPASLNEVYNVAVGARTTLNELWQFVNEINASNISAIYGPEREGDIPHSLANISKAKTLLDYEPSCDVLTGLKKSFAWYQSNLQLNV